jgi:hypothetical protein
VKEQAAAICRRIIDARIIHAKFVNFANPGNRSNVESVAPDPGGCICLEIRGCTARAGFFVIRSNAGQDAADRRNGAPAG